MSTSALRDGWIDFLSGYRWDWFTSQTFRLPVHPEAADKVFVQADLGTSAQKIRLWMNRDYATVPNPTEASIVITTTGGTYQGALISDQPEPDGSFVFDLGLTLSASTDYKIEAAVTDATGTQTTTETVST